ncbi:hypothetical protein Phum_PHUM097040 [Pediculus humanus corporis]|uniref:Uncharacterized protein n=1 Tax=Pediculus humanus subsp. corporis TaxID=121224 RepID=E0VCT0_PEDHC|nr:uncharacterized protein Phum_PHUM097040 [Pediculus humanus corporis]EEB11186.1 hypothetical protein Phum_PHUM097040 [Pediculus humanus corporis]
MKSNLFKVTVISDCKHIKYSIITILKCVICHTFLLKRIQNDDILVIYFENYLFQVILSEINNLCKRIMVFDEVIVDGSYVELS